MIGELIFLSETRTEQFAVPPLHFRAVGRHPGYFPAFQHSGICDHLTDQHDALPPKPAMTILYAAIYFTSSGHFRLPRG
jgi:hypothetical protein